MKCPKCGYLGFEHVERCRNCGYDFALALPSTLSELPLHSGSDQAMPSPLDDLTFGDPPAGKTPPPAAELPLFGPPIPDDDRPLITKVSPPRPPLSVRRATPEVPRLRTEPRMQALDLALEPDLGSVATTVLPSAAGAPEHADYRDASVGARLLAVVIDLVILALVDSLVVYLTMQICGITMVDFDILPKGPLIAFLLLQNGGYLVAFTAGGQTLGKMAAGIRVVSSDDEATLDVGRALMRTLMWFVLAIPAGLGFLSALVSRDHRGLHDRFAGTRVVR
jgi:uncharacterized RDD family membrane protein YckC